MFEVEEGDVLVKVHSYQIQRQQTRELVHIDVFEIIVGKADAKFFAVPMDHPHTFHRAPEKFYGKADTEHEALKKCLTAIRGVSKAEIFPEDKKR